MTSPLDRAVEVMDRLRSPGGCPWDEEQTHASLTRYLVEETYEVIEAIETEDPVLLREELGDLLLQVLFHARIAQEAPGDAAFGIDEVAGDLADKLVRRHPHVFAGEPPGDAADLNEAWERRKIEEKGRRFAADGVPLNQPALALAAKLVSRAARAGLDAAVASASASTTGASTTEPPTTEASTTEASTTGPSTTGGAADVGPRLLSLVREAVAAGRDPEADLRAACRSLRAAMQDAEASGHESA